MSDEKVQVYVSPGCEGCDEVKAAVDAGALELQGVNGTAEVELVDVTAEGGYETVKELGLDTVPAAYYKGQRCELLVDDETRKVVVKCGAEDAATELAANPKETDPPPLP